MSENVLTGGKLAEALSKAQKVFKTPIKSQSVTYSGRTFKYADLADVIDATRDGLSNNGLALTQEIDLHETKGSVLITSLMHSSGEMRTSYYALPDPSKIKPQEFGASLTYARRYSLSAILNVASEEDTDGNGSSNPDPKPDNKPEPKPKTSAAPKKDFKPLSPREHIAKLIADKKLSGDVVNEAIKHCCDGVLKKSGDMTEDELKLLAQYLILK